MANYTVVDYSTPVGTLLQVTAAMETKLETLDSTTNTIYFIDVKQTVGGAYVGVILYLG